MKDKLTKKNQTLLTQLSKEYQEVFAKICEHVQDEGYTKAEINLFLHRTLLDLKKSEDEKQSVDEVTSHNVKKYAIEMNKHYKELHIQYVDKSKLCDRITYSCYLSVIFYSLTLIAVNFYMARKGWNWLWIAVAAAITLLFIVRKILHSRKAKLSLLYTYSDLIIFAIVTVVSMLSSFYFLLFLWIYDVFFMLYLQKQIVDDCF